MHINEKKLHGKVNRRSFLYYDMHQQTQANNYRITNNYWINAFLLLQKTTE